MIKHSLKIAWQSIVRQKLNSLINISGLAIGMAASVLIFMWVNNELHFDNYHKDAGDIYRLKNYVAIDKKSTWIWENSPYLLGDKLVKELPEVVAVTRLRPLSGDNTFFNVKGEYIQENKSAMVDSAWFSFFNYDFVEGQAGDLFAHPFSMVMTQSKARKYFGSADPIGKTIRIDTIDYQVRAVVRDVPPNSSFQYDVLINLESRRTDPRNRTNDESWSNFNYITFVKLRPATDLKSLPVKMTKILSDNKKSDNIRTGFVALADLHFENDLQSSQMEHGNRKVVTIFAILGLLLLLIACINYVNLVTARATLRAKEVSIKKITGAGRTQLFMQFVIESTLVSTLALALSIGLVQLVLPAYNNFTGKNFSVSVGDTWMWTILIGTLLGSIILTSIYPAILLSSFKPIAIFRGLNALRIKDTSLRRGLVVVQFTIAIVLMVGTIVVYRQLAFINQQSSAYNRSQVLSFSVPYKLYRQYDDLKRKSLMQSVKQELLRQSAVVDVSLINQGSVINMTGSSSGGSNDWDGRDKDFMPAIAFFNADTNFRKIINLEMKEGRWFQTGNSADEHNSILNETAVREFNIHQPVIGQRFVAQGDTGVVIGVVRDFYYKSLHEKIGPVVIRNQDEYTSSFLVKSAPGKVTEARDAASRVWSSFFPAEPFNSKFLDEEFEQLYRTDRKTASLVWLFSAIAIFLSCLGLFGLAAFTAERRTREIGVRKVLGASVPDIVQLISREFVFLVILSLLIATPLAWWIMNQWLEDFSYRISISPLFFAAAGLATLLIALATVSVHAIRSALTNPVKSLRTE
jgi:ABC-type antimicrobial peptide transport system permease subunit